MTDHQRCRQQWRRLITRNGRATGHYRTTVSQVASATKLSPARVVELVGADYWAFVAESHNADAPIEEWTIEEDGE